MIHFGLEDYGASSIYIAGVAAFLLSIFWRPSIGLYLLVFMLPMQTWRYRLHEYPLGSQFIDIMLLGITVGLFLKGDKLELKPLGSSLLLFAGFCYLSLCLGSFYVDAPLPFSLDDPRFSDWKNYVEMFFLSLVVVSVMKEKNEVKLLLIVMCFSFLLVNRSFYATMSDRDLAHFSYDSRDTGPLGYAGENGLGAFEASLPPFLLGLYAYARRPAIKLALLGLIGTGIYCLMFSFSRGGYLGLLAALFVLGILKERKLLLLVGVVLIAWQTVLPESVQERIAMTTEATAPGDQLESSAQERLDLWQDAFDQLGQNPVIGTGFGTYGSLHRVGPYSDTHNYYVKVLVETGVVGLCFFLWLLLRIWRAGFALYRARLDPFWESVGLGFVALMTSALVCNFFGDRWTYQQVDGFLWVLLGCVVRGLMLERREVASTAESEGASLAVAGPVAA